MAFPHVNIQKLYKVTKFEIQIDEIQKKRMRFFESEGSGFIAKPATEIISNILPLHKKIVQEIGLISDLYGFTNIYFQNLVEIGSSSKKGAVSKNKVKQG